MPIGSPSTRSSPLVGWSAPDRILISVDLPAPLSPTRPTISPAFILRSTPCSAVKAPYRLVISRPSITGGTSTALSGVVVIARYSARVLDVRALPHLYEIGLRCPRARAMGEAGRQRLAVREVLVHHTEGVEPLVIQAAPQRPRDPALTDQVEGLRQPVVRRDEDVVVVGPLPHRAPVLGVRAAHRVGDLHLRAVGRVEVLDVAQVLCGIRRRVRERDLLELERHLLVELRDLLLEALAAVLLPRHSRKTRGDDHVHGARCAVRLLV